MKTVKENDGIAIPVLIDSGDKENGNNLVNFDWDISVKTWSTRKI